MNESGEIDYEMHEYELCIRIARKAKEFLDDEELSYLLYELGLTGDEL